MHVRFVMPLITTSAPKNLRLATRIWVMRKPLTPLPRPSTGPPSRELSVPLLNAYSNYNEGLAQAKILYPEASTSSVGPTILPSSPATVPPSGKVPTSAAPLIPKKT